MRLYVRTSRRTGVSVPLWLAVVVMPFVAMVWLLWFTVRALVWLAVVLQVLIVAGVAEQRVSRKLATTLTDRRGSLRRWLVPW